MMLSKATLDILPEKEREIYEQLKELSMPQKKLLYSLIQDADKNGVALYPEENGIMLSLIKKGYVTKNEAYHGKGCSYFILINATHLLNELHYNSKKDSKYLFKPSNAVDLLKDKGGQDYKSWGKKEYLAVANNPVDAFMNSAGEYFYEGELDHLHRKYAKGRHLCWWLKGAVYAVCI